MKILYVSTYDSMGDNLSINGMINFLSYYYEKIIIFMDFNFSKCYEVLYAHNSKVETMSHDYFMINGSNFDHSNDEVDFLYLLELSTWRDTCKIENTFLCKRGHTICATDFLERVTPKNVFSESNPIGSYLNIKYDEEIYKNLSEFVVVRDKIPLEIKYRNFHYDRVYEEEEKLFNKLNLPEKYAVVCEYGENKIDKKYIKSECVVNLHNISNFFDTVKIIENASEIHLIENSVAIFVYLLQLSGKIEKKKVHFHLYVRKYDVWRKNFYKLFTNPKLDNWSFIE
jgi:hypothetical protein